MFFVEKIARHRRTTLEIRIVQGGCLKFGRNLMKIWWKDQFLSRGFSSNRYYAHNDLFHGSSRNFFLPPLHVRAASKKPPQLAMCKRKYECNSNDDACEQQQQSNRERFDSALCAPVFVGGSLKKSSVIKWQALLEAGLRLSQNIHHKTVTI